MKGSYLNRTRTKASQPLSQLSSSTVRIGKSKDLLRVEVARGDSMGNPMRDGPRLTAAGSSNDANWAFEGCCSLKLLGIQGTEDVTTTLSAQFES